MVTEPSGEQYELAHGDQRVVVVEVGGGLRTYSAGGRELLDGYSPDELCSAGRGQVLAPWPNRIEDGRYDFGGGTYQLPLDELERRNAIHGLVRWAVWAVAERESPRVVLEHVLHPQPGYPFTLELRVEYALSDAGLSVRTAATNVGPDPCPYGCGMHPYLTVGVEPVDTVVLRIPASTVLRSDDRAIPVGSEPVEGTEHDFRQPRPIGATLLDHCFTDLERDEDGLASVTLRDPEAATEIALWVDESFGYLMVFTGDPLPDVARRSLAVEPMTCAPNAFRSGDGLIVLQPGQTFSGAWGISAGRTSSHRDDAPQGGPD
jgi:aldose 1-epimerase